MTPDERLDRLEQRIATLEGLVRRLTSLLADKESVPPPIPPPIPPPSVRAKARDEELARSMGEPIGRKTLPRMSPDAVTRVLPSAQDSPPPIEHPPARLDSEQWFGQRGLLAVGVIFLVLAAGYLLKLSFERGWISPLVRCLGGAVVGVVVGAVGWRLHGRGLKTYGAALIGSGAAIIYLAVWAATNLYQFLPQTNGIIALALVSLSLAAIAYAIDVEALGASAVLGAFFAPILLGREPGNVSLLLLYEGFMAASLGSVAARRRWRMASFLVAASYFGIATSGVLREAHPALLYAYGLIGGAAGLYLGLREGWWETRLLSFGGGWGVLGVANQVATTHWATLAGGVILAAPVWWRGFTSSTIWPSEQPAEGDGKPSLLAGLVGRGWSPGESFYFYATPFLLGWATREVSPAWFDAHRGVLEALVALPYLAAGFQAVRLPFAVLGTTGLGVAALTHWTDLPAVWCLFALAHLWAGADHLLRRSDGRWYALVAFAAGLIHLLVVDLPARPDGDTAFIGAWPLTLWWAIETCAVLAAGLLRRPADQPERTGVADVHAVLWLLAGVLLLFGVTGELVTLFRQSDLPAATAALAGGLSVSAWWVVCAAALVLFGFRREIKPVRVAGLLVAGLAVLKVVLFDLSTLDALYRVASVFILGLVSLALAYVYHKSSQSEG